MESFNATYSDGKIKIVSNTYWYTNCTGNINLSKYSGEGNDEITVLLPNGISYVQGTAYLSYGGKYCTDFPSINIGKRKKVNILSYWLWKMERRTEDGSTTDK